MSTNLNISSDASMPHVKTSASNWYVVYTKPRHEIKVSKHLSLMGIVSFCPTIIKINQWSDRKKKIKTPALPSIVFVKLKVCQRNSIFDCPGVVRYMFFDKKIVTISQNEIDVLRNHLEGKKCLNSFVSNLNIGDMLKVEQFQNRVGEVVNIKSNKVWIKIQSLNLKVRLNLI